MNPYASPAYDEHNASRVQHDWTSEDMQLAFVMGMLLGWTAMASLVASVGAEKFGFKPPALTGFEDHVRDRVDLVEFNHFYDEQGRNVFNQLIFYDWDSNLGEFVCRASRTEGVTHVDMATEYLHDRGTYRTTWLERHAINAYDSPQVELHICDSKFYRETWTHYDPELENRSLLPKERRRGLSTRRLP